MKTLKNIRALMQELHRSRKRHFMLLPADKSGVYYLDAGLAQYALNFQRKSPVTHRWAIPCSALLTLFVLLPGVLFFVLDAFNNARFASQGQETMAEVIDCERGKNGPWLTYRYTATDVNGYTAEYRGTEGASRCLFAGESVLIIYLPENPGLSHPVERSSSRSDAGVGLAAVFMGGFFLLLAVSGLVASVRFMRARWLYQRLTEGALVLQGTFVGAVWEPDTQRLVVKYMFIAPDGERIQGVQQTSYVKHKRGKLPIGRPVRVAYIDAQNYTML